MGRDLKGRLVGSTRVRRSKKCLCGCGKLANPGKKYINGHTMKGRAHPNPVLKKGMCLMSKEELAAHCRRLSKKNIGRKHTPEELRKMSLANIGPNHPNWQGGKDMEEYCDAWRDKEYKADIIERDGFECKNPECWGTNKKLCIHHIDYDKKNCQLNNLITLCNSCNGRANYNREYWRELYSGLHE
jgi:hypothetical protein